MAPSPNNAKNCSRAKNLEFEHSPRVRNVRIDANHENSARYHASEIYRKAIEVRDFKDQQRRLMAQLKERRERELLEVKKKAQAQRSPKTER